jgi:hypothetical protein
VQKQQDQAEKKIGTAIKQTIQTEELFKKNQLELDQLKRALAKKRFANALEFAKITTTFPQAYKKINEVFSSVDLDLAKNLGKTLNETSEIEFSSKTKIQEGLALILFTEKKYDQMIALLQPLLTQELEPLRGIPPNAPKYAMILFALAQVRQNPKSYISAANMLQKAQALPSSQLEEDLLHYVEGSIFLEQGRIKEATQCFQTLREPQALFSRIPEARAIVQPHLARYTAKNPIEALSAIISSEQISPSVRYNAKIELIKFYLIENQIDSALNLFTESAETQDSTKDERQELMGQIYTKMYQTANVDRKDWRDYLFGAAKKNFESLISESKIPPHIRAQAEYDLGNLLYLKTEEQQNAKDIWLKMCANPCTSTLIRCEVLESLKNLYFFNGQLTQAEDLLKEIVDKPLFSLVEQTCAKRLLIEVYYSLNKNLEHTDRLAREVVQQPFARDIDKEKARLYF